MATSAAPKATRRNTVLLGPRVENRWIARTDPNWKEKIARSSKPVGGIVPSNLDIYSANDRQFGGFGKPELTPVTPRGFC